ncbi:hypothetical protein glysoja_033917 [Glycine soja]|uniref:DUF3700 domain-containing protein n=1 Tax=Glycine soja TaxID=3848 RepID=A0A0B2SDT1_GLYSO|nr:hypothetical protein glysoja_033917 [Glycine soja]
MKAVAGLTHHNNAKPVADSSFSKAKPEHSLDSQFKLPKASQLVPLYWGIAADGYVAFADDADLLKGSCGKSLASFPQGCFYFTEIGGLKCYENPKNKITAVPAEEEEIWGVFFKVTR